MLRQLDRLSKTPLFDPGLNARLRWQRVYSGVSGCAMQPITRYTLQESVTSDGQKRKICSNFWDFEHGLPAVSDTLMLRRLTGLLEHTVSASEAILDRIPNMKIEISVVIQPEVVTSSSGNAMAITTLFGLDARITALLPDQFGVYQFSEIDLLRKQPFDPEELIIGAIEVVRRRTLYSRIYPQDDTPRTRILADPLFAAVLVHEAVGHSLEADVATTSGPRMLRCLPGSVWGENLTVVSDPTVGSEGSYMFDDEGIEGRPVCLLDQGRIAGWVHDRASADRFATVGGHGRSDVETGVCRPRTSHLVSSPSGPNQVALEEGLSGSGLLFEGCIEGHSGDTCTLRPLSVSVLLDGQRRGRIPPLTLNGAPWDLVRAIVGVGLQPEHLPAGLGGCGKGKGALLDVGSTCPALILDVTDLREDQKICLRQN